MSHKVELRCDHCGKTVDATDQYRKEGWFRLDWSRFKRDNASLDACSAACCRSLIERMGKSDLPEAEHVTVRVTFDVVNPVEPLAG